MTKARLFHILILTGCTITAGCSNNDKPLGVPAAISKKPVMMEPFRFHKLVEVSPGQDYDVVSWGRGLPNKGAFAILHSDSAAAKYTTTTGDLDGAIVDVYNSDMDLDGNPEILIQAKGKDTVNYTSIYAFEFTGGRSEKLNFPKLTKSQRQGYRGGDNFYITEGILIREFPVYDGNGTAAKPTGKKRRFQYGLRNNSFTIKQLDKDSAAVSTPRPVAVARASSPTIKKKKHTISAPKKHKKKHRRRNNH